MPGSAFGTEQAAIDAVDAAGETLLTLANEPSVGLFYVQEHYRGTIRRIAELKDELEATKQVSDGIGDDARFGAEACAKLIQPRHFDGLAAKLDRAKAVMEQEMGVSAPNRFPFMGSAKSTKGVAQARVAQAGSSTKQGGSPTTKSGASGSAAKQGPAYGSDSSDEYI